MNTHPIIWFIFLLAFIFMVYKAVNANDHDYLHKDDDDYYEEHDEETEGYTEYDHFRDYDDYYDFDTDEYNNHYDKDEYFYYDDKN